ncbi:GTP-binding protein TypA [Magnetococcus marinus MC-1]|uniref:Large ribosomal subunit assembly factor BipA n=1 Tax=Magnetococcus marinus (strain ATCC BAA-1437 / JCM 17883 / MC-1) TaxID=156889 RepID=A0L7W1_MAGMM|nr:translational GTPase TypA [Magnetococcus marinus]ABK44054.1 GTP-binding protein TypA [Magnetococcus marinus MC-1]
MSQDVYPIEKLRNIAIIAHVDHGKTTLVDKLLQQSGTLKQRGEATERVMDSNDLEKERGITILAKNTAIYWNGYRINIVDTPGHADFGGEVERVLSMVDSVLLLVDAVEGPMPQTRFVTQKAFAQGLRPIVVVNKIDRDGARPDWVQDQTFDLFDKLDATDEQLDFPIIYTSALRGFATLDHTQVTTNMDALFETIIKHVSPPDVDQEGPFRMQVTALDYNSYVGIIGIGRIARGRIKSNSPVVLVDADGSQRNGRMLQLFGFLGLDKVEVPDAKAGDIIAFTGIEKLRISETICHPDAVEPLPLLSVDEPTVSMTFQVNDSPLAGREGKFVTSRQLRDRLMRELETNVALRVEELDDPDKFRVSGRGELHLGILIENMRREGYELGVSRPEVIVKEIDGERREPYEQLTVDIDETSQGKVMEALGERKGELVNMVPDGRGRVRLDYMIPARGLIGFLTEFRTMTSGTGLMYHVFDHFGPYIKEPIGQRINGVLIAKDLGETVAFALFNLQERGRLFSSPGDKCYEGMLIGIHSRGQDLVVNPMRAKQLTNIRAAGCDENINLVPPIRFNLEEALEFIDDDELVEVTPKSIRLRKRFLKEHERKRSSKKAQ